MNNNSYFVTRYHSYRQQQGAVLIIALFVVSIIVAVTTRFAGDFQLSVARSEQQIVGAQLQHYLYSVESFASWALIQDAQADKDNNRYEKNGMQGNYDHLGEEWTSELAVPIEEATVQANLEDALGRFNVNQLQGRPSPYKPNGLFAERFTIAQQRFVRLLQTHPDGVVDLSLAQLITEAVIDWVDTDDAVTGIGGAESDYYQSLEKPYRAANQFLSTISELRKVKGMTDEIYQYIAPFLIALPNTQGINVNTASLTVMRSLNQVNVETPLSEEDANTLISFRPSGVSAETNLQSTSSANGAYESVNDFLESSSANTVFDADSKLWPPAQGLRTGSEYFILSAEAKIVNYRRRQLSIIKRKTIATGITTAVIQRTRGEL